MSGGKNTEEEFKVVDQLIILFQIPCLSCGDVIPDDNVVVVFDCAEHHVICVDCFKMYGLSRLNERQFVLDAKLVFD